MTKKNQDKGPIERDKNPDRYGAGSGADDQQGVGSQDPPARDGAADSDVGVAASEPTGAASSSGEASSAPNPGTAAPEPSAGQDVVREEAHPEGQHQAMRDPIIDRDPGDESFLRERSVDESPEFNQERDAAMEGLHDGPGGRKYLVLNLTDDAHAQAAAGAYAEAIQKDPAKAELAASLFRLAGVNVGRRSVASADTGRTT